MTTALSDIRRAASLARKTFAGGRPRSGKKRCACGAIDRETGQSPQSQCLVG